MPKREEITDVIDKQAYDDPEFKRGLVLRFANATLKITRVDRKNKRTWAEHWELYLAEAAVSHYGHMLERREDGKSWCKDCDLEISQMATKEGERKAAERNASK